MAKTFTHRGGLLWPPALLMRPRGVHLAGGWPDPGRALRPQRRED